MKNENQKKGKINSNEVAIIFSIILVAAAFLFELYFMLKANVSELVLCILAFVILLALYFCVLNIIYLKKKNQQFIEEKYEAILKSEKASYLLQRKYFNDIGEHFTQVHTDAKQHFEEITLTEKSVGKIVMKKILSALRDLEENNSNIHDKAAMLELILQDVQDSQNEVASLQKNVTDAMQDLRHEILKQLEGIRAANSTIETGSVEIKANNIYQQADAFQMDPAMGSDAGRMESAGNADDIWTKPAMEADAARMESAGNADDVWTETDAETEAAQTITDMDSYNIPAESDGSTAEADMELESILNSIAKESAQADANTMPSERTISEPLPEPAETAAEPMPEPAAAAAPITNAAPLSEPAEAAAEPMPEPASAAAPIANAAPLSEPAEAAAEPMPEVAPAPEPAPEEKPPMPDLSNPNKVMTPEEIAALIANL